MKELGSGGYGVVFLAKNKKTCKNQFLFKLILFLLAELRAVKAIAKDRIEDTDLFTNEISLLNMMVIIVYFNLLQGSS